MADIEIRCPVCDKVVTVSEFADADSLFCHSCGEKLTKPAFVPSQERTKRTVNKPVMKAWEGLPGMTGKEEQAEEGTSNEWRFHRHTRKREKKKSKVHVGPAVISWFLFALFAAISFTVRYKNVLSEENLKLLIKYGPVIVLAFHILIVLKAFKDSVYVGTLSLLIPGYSLYYLFLVCDDFYLRGVVGGILVGLGQDAFIVSKDIALYVYKVVADFIGGGALRP